MEAGSQRKRRMAEYAIFGVVAVALVALVLFEVVTVTPSSTSSTKAVLQAKVTYDTVSSNSTGSVWEIEVENTGNSPIVGVSVVRVIASLGGGGQNTSISIQQSNPFQVEDSPNPLSDCLPNCASQAFLAEVSTTVPLGPGYYAYTTIPSSGSGNSQFFEDCATVGNYAGGYCTVNVLVTYSDGTLGFLNSPVSAVSG